MPRLSPANKQRSDKKVNAATICSICGSEMTEIERSRYVSLDLLHITEKEEAAFDAAEKSGDYTGWITTAIQYQCATCYARRTVFEK